MKIAHGNALTDSNVSTKEDSKIILIFEITFMELTSTLYPHWALICALIIRTRRIG